MRCIPTVTPSGVSFVPSAVVDGVANAAPSSSSSSLPSNKGIATTTPTSTLDSDKQGLISAGGGACLGRPVDVVAALKNALESWDVHVRKLRDHGKSQDKFQPFVMSTDDLPVVTSTIVPH